MIQTRARVRNGRRVHCAEPLIGSAKNHRVFQELVVRLDPSSRTALPKALGLRIGPASLGGPRRRSCWSAARGFTYLTVLFLVAILGVAFAMVGEASYTAAMREKEKELLFIGGEYRKAIMLYYEHTRGAPQKYPTSLEQLLKDDRYPDTRRYLRKLYWDPVTNKPEWGIDRAPDGGIMGVYSLSDRKVFKVAKFGPADRDLEGKTRYSEWKFFYSPSPEMAPKPGQAPQLTSQR